MLFLGTTVLGLTGYARTDMPTSRLSTRGRLRVPLDIQQYLGVRPGDRLEFGIDDDGRVTLRPVGVDLRSLRGALAREGQRVVSMEEMKQAARGDR